MSPLAHEGSWFPRPARRPGGRAAARLLLVTSTTLLAPPSTGAPLEASGAVVVEVPAAWRAMDSLPPDGAPPTVASSESRPVPPSLPPSARAAAGVRSASPDRRAGPRRMAALAAGQAAANAAAAAAAATAAATIVAGVARRGVAAEPRLRDLPAASLPWLASSGEALLAALGALEEPGRAPDLVRTATLGAGWTLVSVPLVASNTQASSVFASLPQPLWLYDYAAGQTMGVGEAGFRSVVPGRGFWLLLRQPVSFSIAGLAVNPTVEQRLPLSPGWNAIGTPWLTSVEWADARVSVRHGVETVALSEAVTRGWVDTELFQYDPSSAVYRSFPANGTPVGELRVWEGSLVHSTIQGELVLSPPPPDSDPPTISLSPPPVEGQVITAPTEIRGTVDDPNLAEWRLELAPAGTTTFTTFASGTTPVTNGVLGTLDPTLLLNGQYQVRFVASDVFGQTSILGWTVVVKEDLKVGNFSISFVDIEVPLAGMPIQVTRTYDSRDKGKGDFGIGWRLSLSDVRLSENGVLGLGWSGTRSGGLFPTYCIQEAKEHKVTVTMPDGEVHEFRPTTTPQCQQILPPQFSTLGFQALPGTNSKLEPLDAAGIIVNGGWPTSPGIAPITLLDDGTIEPIDPNRYRLTLADGRAFVFGQQTGLQSITDLNGNQLVFGPNGITHSSGVGVSFTRDVQGRITRITDPLGNFTNYAYDAAGDLVGATDLDGHTTGFTYNSSHGLLSVLDPLGRQPVRNDYDASGRLVRHTDAFGRAIEFTHDLVGRQEVVTDRLGHTRVLSYDSRGNVIQEVDQNGQVLSRTFDANGNRTSETDANGHTRSWSYDANDNLLSETDPLGQKTEYTYNALNRPLTVKDPRGNQMVYAYDTRGNLTSSTDFAGVVTTYTYDTRGNRLSESVSVGGVAHTTTFGYDSSGRVTSQTDPTGAVTQYTYDAKGNRLTQRTTRTLYACAASGCTPSGSETLLTSFEYDKSGRVTKTTFPDGTFSRTVYDPQGRQAETFDALGRRTAHEYDVMGRLLKTTFPDGTFEEAGFDAENRLVSRRDRAGRVTLMEYDAVGRPTRQVYPDASFETLTYDAGGRLVATTDGRGKQTTYSYDDAGRRTRARNPLGQETVFTYDANGNQLSTLDARGNTTSYQYDAANRRVRTTFADGTFVADAYDELGQRVAHTDQAGRQTRFEYDKAGRLTKVVDALLQETLYSYDERGNRITQVDANGRRTGFEYDRQGRLLRRVLPDGSAEVLGYDAVGNVASRTDFAGRTTTYTYDAADRLLSRTYPDTSSVGFTYSASGQRLTAVDGRGTTTYTYDLRDRLASVSEPGGARLAYTHDANGNRTALVARLPGGPALASGYTYDDAGRLASVTDPLGRVTQLAHDPNGNRASLQQPNGVLTSYTYDVQNRLTGLVSTHGPTSGVVQAYTLTLGPAGNRTRISEAGGRVRDYTYDALYRLTGESAGGPLDYTKTFSYDAVGNRSSQTTTTSLASPPEALTPGTKAYNYDTRDRLLDETGVVYGWDANGNLTSASGEALYVWDFDDRLVRVEKTDGTVVSHVYDADGRRVRTSTTLPGQPAQVTDYLVDPGDTGGLSHVVVESDGSGTLRALYVRALDELVSVLRPDGTGGWTTRFYHSDATGSVRALTDESGAVTDSYDYTAFGEPIAHLGSDPQPYAFAGEPYDPNVGFQYHRARWLDPATGRFTSMDRWPGSLYDPPSLHRYLYADADPVGHVDPSGQFSLGSTMATMAVAGILNAAIGAGFSLLSGQSISAQQLWGDFAIGALTAPVGGFLTRVFAPIIRSTMAPLLRMIGSLERITLVGARTGWERFLVNFSRIFFNTNRTYPAVNSTFLGRLLQRAFPHVRWEQHHVFIQQAWSRAGSARQLYDDVLANEGLRRVGNGLWNLLPIPRELNNLLGRSPLGTQLLATFYYSILTFGPTQALIAVVDGD